MKIEFEVKDPKFKGGDIVLSIYAGVGEVSSISASSINLHYLINRKSNDTPEWCHEVYNNGNRFIPERNLYSLTDIMESIKSIGKTLTAKRLRIDVSYIELCETYIAEWEADGRAEAAGS